MSLLIGPVGRNRVKINDWKSVDSLLTVFLLLFVNLPCENYPESSDFIHKLLNDCQFSLLFSF